MANDIQDRIGQLLGSDTARALAGTAVSEALKAVGARRSSNGFGGHRARPRPQETLSGVRGLAAGAGAAAVAPIAVKGVGKLIKGRRRDGLSGGPQKLAERATSKLGETVEGRVKEKVAEAGGSGGILKSAIKSALPGGGSGKQDTEGVGKGRRMPIQQSIDIALPVETVYNQWTQFDQWPKFMHRVTRVSQENPCQVSFAVKIWGKTKEFTAEIETQRPDDRIKWRTKEGINHSGVVTFRELGPGLTRVMLSFDVAPGSLLEKYARGARYVKRAARADLHRFAAFIEMLGRETGAWRGVIEDGELVEDHDPGYDKQREYRSAAELAHGRGADEDEHENGRGGGSRERSGRSGQTRSGGRSRSSGGRAASAGRSSGSRRSASSGTGTTARSGTGTDGGSRRSTNGRNSSGSSGQRSSAGRSASRSSARSNGTTSRSRASASGNTGAGARGASRTRSASTPRGSRSSAAEHQGRARSRSAARS